MSTYKRSGPDGLDYAFPSKRPLPPPPPPHPPCPKPFPPVPPVPPEDWAVYPYYPPYQEPIEPVACPPIPGRVFPPCPPPPFPPYPIPKPEKVDESSKRLAALSEKVKVLVRMIKDFEQKNKPAILTIGKYSYQFGTENVISFAGEPAKGMYAGIISGTPIDTLESSDYTTDESGTRVALKNPTDLLQSELARVRQEIILITEALNEELDPQQDSGKNSLIPGTDENT